MKKFDRETNYLETCLLNLCTKDEMYDAFNNMSVLDDVTDNEILDTIAFLVEKRNEDQVH